MEYKLFLQNLIRKLISAGYNIMQKDYENLKIKNEFETILVFNKNTSKSFEIIQIINLDFINTSSFENGFEKFCKEISTKSQNDFGKFSKNIINVFVSSNKNFLRKNNEIEKNLYEKIFISNIFINLKEEEYFEENNLPENKKINLKIEKLITNIFKEYKNYDLKEELTVEEILNTSGEYLISKKKQNKAYVTNILIILNIVYYIFLLSKGAVTDSKALMKYGGNTKVQVLYLGEYWRLFTSMFIHGGLNHLFNNMFSLFIIGKIVELQLGSLKFLLVYLFSGIFAGIMKLFIPSDPNIIIVSVGASGCIFGLLGVILALILLSKRNVEHLSIGTIILVIGLNLINSFSNPNIDNLAHALGFVAGFILVFLFGKIYIKMKNKNYEKVFI